MDSAVSTSATRAAAGAPVNFRGTIQRIVFRKEETGFSVLRVEPSDPAMGRSVAVLGATLADEGNEVTIVGAWDHHAKYGDRIKADSIVAVRPSSPDAIQRYLSSGVLPGVGEGIAKRIVARFGRETLEIMDREPERLLEVRGIGERKIDAIIEGWKEQQASREILLFLAGQGISPAMAIRIYKQYGNKAIEVIRQNPYRLAADVRGIGFPTADKIAMTLGVPPNSAQRIEAGLRHVVQEATARGHCGITRDDALGAAGGLLALHVEAIAPVLDAMLRDGESRLVSEMIPLELPCVFPRRLHFAEGEIARRLRDLARLPGLWADAKPGEVAALVSKVDADSGRAPLVAAQRAAVELALTRRVSVLTGGPGTGKTSTLNVLLAALHARRLHVRLGAPTGKAAKRMREATGHDAQTVARMIGMGTMNTPPIECDVLVLDEASMVDVPMMQSVLEQLDPNASLVLVGDVDQLPSVGPGRVLGDLIDSGGVPVTRLTEVFRQAAQSAIIRNSHRINQGVGIETEPPPGTPPPDFHFIECNDPQEVVRRITQLVTVHIPERIGIAPADVQVLTPMRKTETGTDNLNHVLQEVVNPSPSASVVRNAIRFGVGDRVLQTRNNYDLGVMNGESGIVRAIDKEANVLRVEVDGCEVEYPIANLEDLTLAYAMTVHKSQGSQFPAIVMPLTTQHYRMLLRPILYTGITRAARFCVLVGQRKALHMAIENAQMEPRLTRLSLLLRKVERARS